MARLPPELTAETYAGGRSEVVMHDHAVCAYEDEADLVAPLAAFIDEGLRKRELTVFVHSFDTEAEAWAFLRKARPDAEDLRSDQLVVVSLYKQAFQGDRPHIDYAHVQGVIEGLIQAAREADRAGVRIFVDASRRYLADTRTKEWFAFESWLGRRLQASVGLVCAYRKSDIMRPDIFPDVLRTHAYRFDAPHHH